MTDDITQDEVRLRQLGERLRKAWARERPLTQEELEVVRQTVRHQWEQEIQRIPPPRGVPKAEDLTKTQPRSQGDKQKRQKNEDKQQQGPRHSY